MCLKEFSREQRRIKHKHTERKRERDANAKKKAFKCQARRVVALNVTYHSAWNFALILAALIIIIKLNGTIFAKCFHNSNAHQIQLYNFEKIVRVLKIAFFHFVCECLYRRVFRSISRVWSSNHIGMGHNAAQTEKKSRFLMMLIIK